MRGKPFFDDHGGSTGFGLQLQGLGFPGLVVFCNLTAASGFRVLRRKAMLKDFSAGLVFPSSKRSNRGRRGLLHRLEHLLEGIERGLLIHFNQL
jgi:hypothetical protein